MAHTIQETIELAVKTAILRAHPIGSYYLTEGTENPQDFIGGGWEKLTGRYVLQRSDANHKAGTTVEAGLPNIKGQTDNPVQTFNWDGSMRPGTGAIVASLVTGVKAGTQGTGYNGVWIDFDASKSNSIYGNSDTVQPPARIVNVWKRVS